MRGGGGEYGDDNRVEKKKRKMGQPLPKAMKQLSRETIARDDRGVRSKQPATPGTRSQRLINRWASRLVSEKSALQAGGAVGVTQPAGWRLK